MLSLYMLYILAIHNFHIIHNHLEPQCFQGFQQNLLFHFKNRYGIIFLLRIIQTDRVNHMAKLTIYREESAAYTVVSNRFIDQYMTDANDAQLKVYLYLLCTSQCSQATSVSDMADRFNHTEKDILRALKYWETKGLVALDYDEAKNLTSIRLLTAEADSKKANAAATVHPGGTVSLPVAKQTPSPEPVPAPEKPSYSLDDLKAFRSNEETEQLLFIVEQYIGKPLGASEIRTILFIYDKLGFSSDLIDYLVQYCVGKEKRSFRYIEKVALDWAENHITTPKQAKSYALKYDKSIFTIMKCLGKNGEPTAKEVTFITRWTKEWGFSLPVIETACERTVLAVDKHRFEYADSILASWNRSQIHTIEDIRTADAVYHKTRHVQHRPSVISNQFNQFPQREYDFDALEKELLSN